MDVGPDNMFGWKELATGGAVMVSGLVAWAVNTFTDKLKVHEKEDRENFLLIFKGQKDISDKVSDGFRGLDKTVSDIHVKLLERINDISQGKEGK